MWNMLSLDYILSFFKQPEVTPIECSMSYGYCGALHPIEKGDPIWNCKGYVLLCTPYTQQIPDGFAENSAEYGEVVFYSDTGKEFPDE